MDVRLYCYGLLFKKFLSIFFCVILGFDPWKESHKGFADLISEETASYPEHPAAVIPTPQFPNHTPVPGSHNPLPGAPSNCVPTAEEMVRLGFIHETITRRGRGALSNRGGSLEAKC